MKKSHVILDFVGSPIPEKLSKGRNVASGLDDNPGFTNPDVVLADLIEVTDMLEQDSVAAAKGGPTETAKMHQTEKMWVNLMRKEALYVDRIADGDERLILSSGFSISKQPVPAQRPEFSAELGEKSGTVILRRKAYQNAKTYVWQYCECSTMPDESKWLYAGFSTKATMEITDLKPSLMYWFRVAAVTKDGTTSWSVPIMQMMI